MPSLLSFHHVYHHDVELQEICVTFCQITFGSHGKQCGISDIQVGERIDDPSERKRKVGRRARKAESELLEWLSSQSRDKFAY